MKIVLMYEHNKLIDHAEGHGMLWCHKDLEYVRDVHGLEARARVAQHFEEGAALVMVLDRLIFDDRAVEMILSINGIAGSLKDRPVGASAPVVYIDGWGLPPDSEGRADLAVLLVKAGIETSFVVDPV